jgi:hypothetical protein
MLEGRSSNVLLLQFTARLCLTENEKWRKKIFHMYQENLMP